MLGIQQDWARSRAAPLSGPQVSQLESEQIWTSSFLKILTHLIVCVKDLSNL